VCPHAERRDEEEAELLEGDDGRVVEVIVVIVRQDHGVERREIAEGDERREPPLRAREVDGPDAVAPYRIGEEAMAVDLEQDRRVAHPRHPQTRGGGVAKRSGSIATVLGGDVGSAFGLFFVIEASAPHVSFTTGCGFSKCEPCHSGDWWIRARLAPVAHPPNGA